MARNKMNDLRDHLFAQLERLNDESLGKEEIEMEAKRAKAITGVASTIVNSAKVEMQYMRAIGADGLTSPLFSDLNQKALG